MVSRTFPTKGSFKEVKLLKKKKECLFSVIYLQSTDGAICIASKTKEQILEFVKRHHYSDYAIFDGQCLKSFDSRLDVGRLK